MFLVRRLCLLVGVITSAICLQPVLCAQSPLSLSSQELKQGFANGRLLAKPKTVAKDSELAAQEGRSGTSLKRLIRGRHTLRLLEFSKGANVRQTAAQLRASGLYEYVEPDYIKHAHAAPNDPQFGSQWAFQNTGQQSGTAGADISAVTAWDTRHDASSVIVAVIDSGLRATHEDLAPNLWTNAHETANGSDDDASGYLDDIHGINTLVSKGTNGDSDISDDEGHGTMVASVIGAAGNNGKGIAGVAWNVQIMPLKFNDATEVALTSNEIICINYAIAKGAKIINFSYGSPEYSQSEYDAVKAARDAGVIFVAAAGNDGAPNELIRTYPASFLLDNVVSVGSSGRTDSLSDFTNYGALIDLAAPGEDIPVCTKDGDATYDTVSGTSFATPMVSGSLALLAAQFPQDNYRQLINRLLNSVDRLSTLNGYIGSGGRLNLRKALTSTSNRPYNDDFANATALPQVFGYARTSSAGATAEAHETTHGAAGGTSLWWTWTALNTGPAFVDTAGSNFDTTIAVYTGTQLAALTQLASNDDAPGRTTSRVTFNAVGGTTYYIAVDGKQGATGEIALAVDSLPVNDNFAQAEDITNIVNTGSVYETIRSATVETGEPALAVNGTPASGYSVWYKWTASSARAYTLTAYSESFDALVGVYTGTSLANLTLVSSGFHTASFAATTGKTYYFKIDSSDGNVGAFILNLPALDQAIPFATEVFSSPAADSTGKNLAAVDTVSVIGYFSDSNPSSSWENQLAPGAVQFNSPAFASDGSFYITSTTGLYNISPQQTITWSKSYPGTSGSSSSTAIAADGTVYAHSDDGILHAYTTHGFERWSVSVPGRSMSSPSIAADGTIYIGSDNNYLYAINPLDGSVAWSFNAGAPIQASPAINQDGTIYFGTTGSQFFGLRPDGSQVFAVNTGGAVYSSAAISPLGQIIFGCVDNKLYSLSASGQQVFTYTAGGPIYSSPAILSDNSIVFGASDSIFYQLSSVGSVVQRWQVTGSVLSSPLVSDGAIAFGGFDHDLYIIASGASLANSPWPMFRGNASHTAQARSTAATPIIHAVTPSFSAAAYTDPLIGVQAEGAGTLTYLWYFNGNPIGVTSSSLALSNFNAGIAGTYTVAVSNGTSTVMSAPIVVSLQAETNPGDGTGRIINLSARAYAGSDASTLIVGFIVGPGSGAKPILVRGIGPSLQARGVTTFIDDPALKLFSGNTVINSNDNWVTDTQVPAATSTTGAVAFTTNKDAALVANLTAGGYTAQVVAGAASTTNSGVALAEFYDASPVVDSSTPLLTNISARAHVGQGDQVLIVGFIIGGNSPLKVLIRGLGPQLVHQSVPGVLADPSMRLTKLDGTLVAQNDNWGDAANLSEVRGAMTQLNTTQLDAGSKDAVIVTTLQPGAYTAIVSGVGGTTGIGLAEVYVVP